MKIMIDSGAYTAWSRGGPPIDLGDYIEFLKCNDWHCCISLDVIAGQDAQREWRSERMEQAANQSYQNYARMRDAGLDPIPTFHQDEDFTWLDKYRADGADYIAIAPHDGGIHCGPWVED